MRTKNFSNFCGGAKSKLVRDVVYVIFLPSPFFFSYVQILTQMRFSFFIENPPFWPSPDIEATNVITQGIDFAMTQLVDDNWGVHAVVLKMIFAKGAKSRKNPHKLHAKPLEEIGSYKF